MFRQFRAMGSRVRRGPLTIVALSRPDSDGAGMAFAVSRRVGGAVVRNRLRRQLRAAAEDLERAGELPAAWYLVVVNPGAVGSSYRTLRGALHDASTAASGRMTR